MRARWHLAVGQHRFEPVAADGFSLFVGREDGSSSATVLSALRPSGGTLPAWGWDLPVGGGTYHALFPRAWQTFEADAVGVRLVGEQLSTGHRRRPRTQRPPGRRLRMVVREPWARARDGGAHVHVGGSRPAAPRTGRLPVDHTHVIAGRLGRQPRRPVRRYGGRRSDRPARHAGDGRPRRGRLEPDRTSRLRSRRRYRPLVRLLRRRPTPADHCGHAAPCRRPHGRGGGRRPVRHDRPRAGRAPIDPVRPRLGPADRGVRWRAALVEALYARLGALGTPGGRPREPRARAKLRHGERRSRHGRHPSSTDPERPAWYRAALFNELYFLVDGGSFWEAGEVGAPSPAADDIGHFALLECVDYPFYDSVDVDFTASFAILELYPELEQRGIRDLLATIPMADPTDRDHRGIRGASRSARSRAPSRTTWAAPRTTPITDPTGIGSRMSVCWKDLGPKFVLQAWRDAVAAGPAGDALIRDVLPTVDAVLGSVMAAIATGTAFPNTTASRTRPMTRGPCTGHRPTAVSSGWAPSPPPNGWRNASAIPSRRTPVGWVVRARPGRIRPPPVAGQPLCVRRRRRVELGQRHGGPARWSVVCRRHGSRRSRPGRPGSVGAPDDLRAQCLRIWWWSHGRRERYAPRRVRRSLERAVAPRSGSARPMPWRP